VRGGIWCRHGKIVAGEGHRTTPSHGWLAFE
jgi:hypothetical protein